MNGEAELKLPRRRFPRGAAGRVRAVRGHRPAIPLEELKYWSVELQEAYATPEAVLQRHPEPCAKAIAASAAVWP